jgi:hypothetical protein
LVAILNRQVCVSRSGGPRCRFSAAIMLSFLAVFATQHVATAQESTRSHRLLGNGLPTLSGGQSQLELLRRLQMLSGASQANGKTPADSPLADPEAMRRLQQAMQSLQKLNPEQFGNTPSDQQGTPPGGDGSLTGNRNSGPPQTPPAGRNSNPDSSMPGSTPERSVLQRIAEQMGLSLDGPNGISPDSGTPGTDPTGTDKTGRQPRPNDRSGTRPIPQGGSPKTRPGQTPADSLPGSEPGQRGSDGTPSAAENPGDSVSRNDTTGRPSTQLGLPSNPPGRSSAGNATPGSNPRPAPGQETDEPTEPPKTSMQDLLDWMKKQDQSARGGGLPSDLAGTSPDRSPATRSGIPSDGQPTKPRTGSGRTPIPAGQGRDDTTTGRPSTLNEPVTPNDSATPERSWFPGGGIAPPRSQQSGSEPGNSATAQRGTNRQGTQPDGSTYNENEVDAALQSARDRLNAQREERLDEVRSSKKTLRQKLTDIAKLARSESDRAETSDDATESGMSDSLQSAFVDALAEATKGLAEQVDEIVSDDRFSRRDRDRRSSRRERGGPLGQFAGLGNRANEWFADAVEPEAPSTSIMSNGLSGVASGGGGFSPRLLAGLFIVCGLAFWMLQKKRVEAQSQNDYSTLGPAPTNLQNRQDIVQAFHDLAARSPAVMADWWTHDRAAQALATSRPDVDDEVRQLAQLYEQARYLPEESALTDEQLAAAKAAWLRCRKS